MAVVDTQKRKLPVGRVVAMTVLIVLVLTVAAILFWSLRKDKPIILPENTFTSRVELRTYLDKDGKKITYYVINTTNTSTDVWYKCRFQTEASGTRQVYKGFFRDYLEKNCFPIQNAGYNYACRVQNAINRYFRYVSAQTLNRFAAGASSEIAVSRFYIDQTLSSQNFLSANRLSDLYNYQVSCKNADGKSVVANPILQK